MANLSEPTRRETLQTTNDATIRGLLIPYVRIEHPNDSETLLIEEFSIYGGSNRADLAVLNGISHGYEIKSDRDTLTRLPDQVNAYGAIFEKATLVSATRHIKAARKIIPSWWGIIEVKGSADTDFKLQQIRQSKPNPEPHAASMVLSQ
jgi:hypothetical protein